MHTIFSILSTLLSLELPSKKTLQGVLRKLNIERLVIHQQNIQQKHNQNDHERHSSSVTSYSSEINTMSELNAKWLYQVMTFVCTKVLQATASEENAPWIRKGKSTRHHDYRGMISFHFSCSPRNELFMKDYNLLTLKRVIFLYKSFKGQGNADQTLEYFPNAKSFLLLNGLSIKMNDQRTKWWEIMQVEVKYCRRVHVSTDNSNKKEVRYNVFSNCGIYYQQHLFASSCIAIARKPIPITCEQVSNPASEVQATLHYPYPERIRLLFTTKKGIVLVYLFYVNKDTIDPKIVKTIKKKKNLSQKNPSIRSPTKKTDDLVALTTPDLPTSNKQKLPVGGPPRKKMPLPKMPQLPKVSSAFQLLPALCL